MTLRNDTFQIRNAHLKIRDFRTDFFVINVEIYNLFNLIVGDDQNKESGESKNETEQAEEEEKVEGTCACSSHKGKANFFFA